jgi:short-subunit dehydrogenase
MYDLKEKVVLISGGSRGLGFAMAEKLGAAGAKLVIAARGEKRLEESRKLLERKGYDVLSVAGDVGVWKDSRRIVDRAVERFKCIDVLVNNAGVSMRGLFNDLSLDVCRQIIDTNLFGSIYLTRAAVDYLKKSKGQVLFISSIAGIRGFPGSSIYCATKGGLKNFCESLRLELETWGVHVGIVFLGYTAHDPEKRILDADGSLILPDRPETHSQEKAAGLILKMIRKQKKQLVTTPLGRFCYVSYRISPWIVEKVVQWAQQKKLRMFKKCY